MDLPDPGIEPGSSALQVDSLPAELLGKSLKLQHSLKREVGAGGGGREHLWG